MSKFEQMYKFLYSLMLFAALSTKSVWANPDSGHFPFQLTDPPPAIGPLHMGMSIADIFAALGLPESGEPTDAVKSGNQPIDYGLEGYYLVMVGDTGLRTIFLTMPQAGGIDGVAVGTKTNALLELWGKPSMQNGRTWIYSAGQFAVEVRISPAGDHISALEEVDLRNPSGNIKDFQNQTAIYRLTDPLPPKRHFPFTQADNVDGARFVWFIYGRSKLLYPYVPAADFRSSPAFRALAVNETPQSGDVVWWPDFVGILDTRSQEVFTAERAVPLSVLEAEHGPPRYYRYQTRSPWGG